MAFSEKLNFTVKITIVTFSFWFSSSSIKILSYNHDLKYPSVATFTTCIQFMTRIVTTHQHAIMLFAKKGSVFFRKSLLFWLLFAVLLCYSCYTCHHFHGPRVGKFISVSVTICMMMCRLSLLSSSLRVGLEDLGFDSFIPTLRFQVLLYAPE